MEKLISDTDDLSHLKYLFQLLHDDNNMEEIHMDALYMHHMIKALQNQKKEKAEWLFHRIKDKTNYDNLIMGYACTQGNLEILKCITSDSLEHFAVYKSRLCFYHSCINGHIDVAMWIAKQVYASEEGTYMHLLTDISDMILKVCLHGHLDVLILLFDLHYNYEQYEVCDQNGSYSWLNSVIKTSFKCLDWVIFDVLDFDRYYAIHILSDRPFHNACKNGHFHVAQWLYNFFLSTNTPIDGKAIAKAYIQSMYSDNLDLVKWLSAMASKENINVNTFKYAASGCFVSCQLGHYHIFEYVFLSCKELMTSHDHIIRMLLKACEYGHVQIAKLILSKRGSIIMYLQGEIVYEKCLKIACQNGRLSILKWLFDINRSGKNNESRFANNIITQGYEYACLAGHHQIAQWMVEKNLVIFDLDMIIDKLKLIPFTCYYSYWPESHFDFFRWAIETTDDKKKFFEKHHEWVEKVLYPEAIAEERLDFAQWILKNNLKYSGYLIDIHEEHGVTTPIRHEQFMCVNTPKQLHTNRFFRLFVDKL